MYTYILITIRYLTNLLIIKWHWTFILPRNSKTLCLHACVYVCMCVYTAYKDSLKLDLKCLRLCFKRFESLPENKEAWRAMIWNDVKDFELHRDKQSEMKWKFHRKKIKINNITRVSHSFFRYVLYTKYAYLLLLRDCISLLIWLRYAWTIEVSFWVSSFTNVCQNPTVYVEVWSSITNKRKIESILKWDTAAVYICESSSNILHCWKVIEELKCSGIKI